MSDNYEKIIAEMQNKLTRIGRNKEKIARVIIREGYINEADYTQEQLDAFAKSLCIKNLGFDLEEDGVNCFFTVADETGLIGSDLGISMLPDNSIEIEGWV